MLKRLTSLSLVGAIVLTMAVVAGVGSSPAGAAPVAFNLLMPDGGGELLLRGSEEPTLLGSPTIIAGTAEDTTGALTGDFSTPTIRTERPITEPVVATAVIDASFTPESAGSTTGSIQPDGTVQLQTRLVVDLHVEVFLDPDLPPAIIADCQSAPVVLTLDSVEPYTSADGGAVTVADEDFTIPAPPEEGTCTGAVYEAIQEQLVGSGHSVNLDLTGELPVPEACETDTTTTLEIDPAGQSRLGDPISMEATVVSQDVENPGPPGGSVNFLVDGDVVGTEPLDGSGIATFTTDTIPSGTYDLSARYGGLSPFCSSTSSATEHLVAPEPTVTTTLPEYVPLGGATTVFDLIIGNSTGGAEVATPGFEVTFKREPASASTLSGVVLEYLSGETWVPVTLAAITGGVGGEMADPAWGPVSPGETQTIKLRLAVNAPTQAGSMRATFTLVDDIEAEEPAVLGSGSALTNMIATDRQPSTTAVGNQFVPGRVPAVVRQGNLFLLRSINVQPAIGGQSPSGLISVTVDGRPVDLRLTNSPLTGGFKPALPFSSTIMARMPTDIPPGTLTIVVKYLGDTHRLPSQASLTIDVIPSGGPVFECTTSVGGSDLVTRFNLIALASLPTYAPSGVAVPLANQTVRALFDRGPTFSSFTSVFGNGVRTAGEGVLRGVSFDYGPGGTGSATGYESTNASLMTATGTDPDLSVDMRGESGSLIVTGEPGEVVPVTLEGITFNFLDPIAGGIPYDLVCEPVEGPAPLGQVTVSGADLSVEAPEPARVGDDVTLTADVVPDGGSVEFFDGETSLGVSVVVDGQAVRTTDDLVEGEHDIVARHTTGALVQSSDAFELDVLAMYECAEYAVAGNSAIVRLVYMELLRRCPDADGFAFWKGQLDSGVSPEAFARTISNTAEARDQIVMDAYDTVLGRTPSLPDREFWRERLKSGKYQDLLAQLSSSNEFFVAAGSTRAGVVRRIFERVLLRPASESDIDYWVGEMLMGKPRSAVMLTIAKQSEPLSRIVDASYDEILSTTPSVSERSTSVAALRATGNRSALYAKLIGDLRFRIRADSFPNPED